MDKFFKKHNLKFCLIFLLLGQLSFYPNIYTNIDEFNYHQNAKNIIKNNLRQECNKEDWSQFEVIIKGDKYCIYKYNIGTSILLTPVTFISNNLIFINTLLFFSISVVVFNQLLQKYKLNSLLLYIYAWFPAFVYFSRTVLSEIYSATFVLLTFYFLDNFLELNVNLGLIKKDSLRSKLTSKKVQGFCAGVCIGVAVLVRYTNVIPLGILGLSFLYRWIKKNNQMRFQQRFIALINDWKFIILGGIPFLILFFVLNKYLYGGIIATGYDLSPSDTNFQIKNLMKVGWKHLLILNLFYPGLLFLGLFSKFEYKWELFITSLSLLFLYSIRGFDKFEPRVLDLILGLRYYIPIVPLLLLSYGSFINEKLKIKWFNYLFKLALIGLLINIFLLNFIHNQYLNNFRCIPRSFTDRSKKGCLEVSLDM